MLVLLLFIIFTYAFLITDKKLRKNVSIIIEKVFLKVSIMQILAIRSIAI